MTTTTRAPAIIDALVAMCAAASGLTDVDVLDGPSLTMKTMPDMVCIGWDGEDDEGGQAVESNQEWAAIGQRAKNETLQISCAAIAWRGDADLRAARLRCYELLGVVENELRSNPSLGFPPPTIVALSVGNAWQTQEREGAQCRVLFTVAVQTRI